MPKAHAQVHQLLLESALPLPQLANQALLGSFVH